MELYIEVMWDGTAYNTHLLMHLYSIEKHQLIGTFSLSRFLQVIYLAVCFCNRHQLMIQIKERCSACIFFQESSKAKRFHFKSV